MSKISNQLQELINQKRALANNLTVKGQVSSENETFNSLVPKVLNIASKDTKLGTKEITSDGVYSAYEDNLDGYSQVSVNILDNADFVATFNGKDSSNTNPKNIKMLKDVPNYAFINEKINKVDLTNTRNIGIWAFRQAGLKSIIAPNPLKVGAYAFYMNSNLIGEITISEEQTVIEDYTFYTCTNLKVNLHDGITKIGNYAFYNCITGNDWASLPSSLKEIGNYAFFQNTHLKLIEIPENVAIIGNYAFRTNNFETIKIHDACTTIGSYCFRYSSTLTGIEIGTGIKSIGSYAFADDTNLKKITIHNTTPPTLGSNVFYRCPLEVVEVPASALEKYKSYTNWSNYADKMIGIEGE